jgi:hypothetical protein
MTMQVRGAEVDADAEVEEPTPVPGLANRRPWEPVLGLVVVVVAVLPIVVALCTLVGDRVFPTGDWAGQVVRVSHVGGRDTPLVGFDSVKGFAHPGPVLFWLSAPLYRLSGGDPRSLAWMAGFINIAVVAGLGMVAWRRGRWPLLLGTMMLAALVIRGVDPVRLVDPWVPFVPLLAFLLTVFLVWHTALGRPQALVVAVAVGTFTAQTHLTYVSLNALLAVWLAAWWWRGPVTVARPDLIKALRRSAIVLGVLWLAPLYDAVFDLHNPWHIGGSLRAGFARVGPVQAIGVVSRYVRPDGAWMGGSEPTDAFVSVQGSGAVPLLIALAVLALCIRTAHRRRLHDALALTTLATVLLVGSVLATAQFPIPNETYYTQWLKVVGGVVWFSVAWTGWRLAEPVIRAVPARRFALAGAVGALLLVTVAGTWSAARDVVLHGHDSGEVVARIDADLREAELPRDATYKVVRRGEWFHVFGAGVTYALIEQGYDVLADEGRTGLKWGHEHRWDPGDDYDEVLTVAVNDGYRQCEAHPDARLVVGYDSLSPEVRAWLFDVQLRRLGGDITEAERKRSDELAPHDLRVGLFAGPRVCAKDPRTEITRTADGSIAPVAAGAIVLVGGVLGALAVRRRHRRTAPRRPGGGSMR